MEAGKLNIFLLIVYSVIVVAIAQDKTYYTGAVVDFASRYEHSLTPLNNIQKNLKEYERYIQLAKFQNADIIVFPECGLTSVQMPDSLSELIPFSTVIPDPKLKIINPCDESKNSQNNDWSISITQLSCAAQKNNIYVVANLPERYANNSSKINELIYNTNIVFDRKGDLIARYRKFNLFNETGFSRTATAELITFKTDFGVTFGTFICFDILFPSPALKLLEKNEDVTDIVYPTAWFSELPFLTAVQTQAGWAKANGVNLLAAGYNNPEGKSGGSGIYTAGGYLNYTMPIKHESQMIVDKIPIIKKRKVAEKTSDQTKNNIQQSGARMETLSEDFKNYSTKLITDPLTDHKFCHNEFCCVFDIKFKSLANADYFYRLVVYDGARVFGTLNYGIQVCGIAACSDNTTVATCGQRLLNHENSVIFENIFIRGDMFINNENSVFFPSYTDYALGTKTNYRYSSTNVEKFKKIEMQTLEQEEYLLGFGIYGTTKSAAVSTLYFTSLLFTVIIASVIHKLN